MGMWKHRASWDEWRISVSLGQKKTERTLEREEGAEFQVGEGIEYDGKGSLDIILYYKNIVLYIYI